MLNAGDRIKITSSSRSRGITTGKIGYIVRALFQPTMRCLLIEAVFVASKPEHKFVVVDIGLTKQIRHKLINGDNIFQIAKLSKYNVFANKNMGLITLENLLVDLSLSLPLTDDYVQFAINDKINVPLVTISVEPVDILKCKKDEITAWLCANILRLNNGINYLFKLEEHSLNGYDYNAVVSEFFYKYLQDVVLNVQTLYDANNRLMLHIDKKRDFVLTYRAYLNFQQFKAALYVLISRVIVERLKATAHIRKIRLYEILEILKSLHKYTLNYKHHSTEFNQYFNANLFELVEVIITSLYNNILLSMEIRTSLLMNLLDPTPHKERVLDYIYKALHRGKFNKAALARFYELG